MRTKNVGLITEINRMRNMMGLRLLTEAIDPSDIIKKSLDVFGVSKGLVDDIQVKIDMSDTLLKNTTDMVKAKLARAGYSDIANVSDDILRGILKNEPNFKTALSKAFEKAVKSKTEELAQNITIPGVADLVTKFKDVIPKPSDDVDTLDLYKGILDDINTELVKLADDITAGRVGGVTSVPKDLTDMIDFFKKTSDDVGTMKTAKTASTTPTTKDVPEGLPVPEVKDVTSMTDNAYDAAIKKYQEDYGDAFTTYKAKVDNLPLSDKVKKQLLLSFDLYNKWPSSALIDEGVKLLKQMNEAQWGWLKKAFLDVQSGKVKAWKLGLIMAGLPLLVSFIWCSWRFGWFVGEVGNDGMDWARNKYGADLPDFDVKYAQKWFDDNNYAANVKSVEPQENGTMIVTWSDADGPGTSTFKPAGDKWVKQ